jgi:hypothetical protein
MRRFIPVFVGVVMMTVGCAGSAEGEAEEEAVAGDDAALTQVQAYQALLPSDPSEPGKTFVETSTGCGHSITLGRQAGDPPNSGHFVYSYMDCDGHENMSKAGTFKIVAGWLDGLVTDPTLEITPVRNPSRPNDDLTPWSYKIRTTKTQRGMMPRGTVYLESTSDHHAELIPQGFIS